VGKIVFGCNAWNLILKDKGSDATITFLSPRNTLSMNSSCSATKSEDYPISELEDHPLSNPNDFTTSSKLFPLLKHSSTSDMHLKRKLSKTPLVVTDLRSERLKGKSNGFRMASCLSRNCFCCNTEPPTLSTNTIKSFGQEFCKISPMVVSDEALMKKPLRKKAAAPKASQNSKVHKEEKK
jgi:hypothetical protein